MSATVTPAQPDSTLAARDPFWWAVALVALLVALFVPTFLALLDVWSTDASYSHGFLIPLISGWLAWHAFRQVGQPVQGDAFTGGSAIVAGCLLHFPALVSGWLFLDFFALVLVLRGIAVCVGGKTWARAFTFPILFLFFMFPLPENWTTGIALWLQNIVSQVSAALLDAVFVCYRRGNALYIAGVGAPLFVAEECSGLRQIVAFVALGTLLSSLGQRPWWLRGLIVVAAIPVAIAANVARVVLMAVVARNFGVGVLDGWMHHAPATITIPVGLALFLLVVWALGRLAPRTETAA
jgi:exosortase